MKGRKQRRAGARRLRGQAMARGALHPADRDALDGLRDHLSEDEIADLGADLTELEQAASSPRAAKRWAQEATREQAGLDALEAALRQLRREGS